MAARIERGDIRVWRSSMSGKRRPALVLTRQMAIPALSTVTIAPISSSMRAVASEVALGIDDGMKKRCAVNLHNLVTVEQRELGRRVGKLGPEKMAEACRALSFALGCDFWDPIDISHLIDGVTQ